MFCSSLNINYLLCLHAPILQNSPIQFVIKTTQIISFFFDDRQFFFDGHQPFIDSLQLLSESFELFLHHL